MSNTIDGTAEVSPIRRGTGYLTLLVILAVVGWALASYDFNLLVVTFPSIAKDLNLSATAVGALGFFVYIAMAVVSFFVGYGMDSYGRKTLWQFALVGTAVFTGLTYFAHSYAALVIFRSLASGFAISELAIAITLVNEELPAKNRGLLYSIVQGGWPLGVFLASGVYLLFGYLGWRTVYLFGILPLVAVIIGRIWIKETDRYTKMSAVKNALRAGDQAKVAELTQAYKVDLQEVEKIRVSQLFATPGPIRRQLIVLSLNTLFTITAWVATNVYVSYWMVKYDGWSANQVAQLLLVSGAFGFFFYVIAGYIGEKIGRATWLKIDSLLIGPLALVFTLIHGHTAMVYLIYFLIFQVTNGLWSGVNYAYWGESFPTRVRGTAVGFLTMVFSAGLILGSILWTSLITITSPTVTWWVIAVGFGFTANIAWFLPNIKPGTELEDISV